MGPVKLHMGKILPLTSSDIIGDFELRINREERGGIVTVYSCLSFYIFVYFIVREGLFLEQKDSFIVIKGRL